jgi:hypothetical protein
MPSFFTQIMEPGGGVMLLPFVRFVIGCLLCLTIAAAVANVARIHMVVLSILSLGLLLSLQLFESEFKKARSGGSGNPNHASTTTTISYQGSAGSNANKTD